MVRSLHYADIVWMPRQPQLSYTGVEHNGQPEEGVKLRTTMRKMRDLVQMLHACRRTVLFALLVTVPVGLISSSSLALAAPAFPGAEGFGANSIGGRGGTVIEVTNLNDSGRGSFRAAIEASGPRIVVFRVGGTIELRSSLIITNPFITIAGQTAPGGGITLKSGSTINAALLIQAHDVIVRYLRMRPGAAGQDGIEILYNTAYNVIIDHCSISWAVDENVSTWYDPHDVTIQWSIISEGLDCSTHPQGCHSMGMIFGSKGSRNISVHHNLFAHNAERNPRVKTSGTVDVVNNLIYNPRFGRAGDWGPSHITNDYAKVPINYVGNYYKAGIDSGRADYYVSGYGATYLEGNITPRRPSNDMDKSVGVIRPVDSGSVVSTRNAAPPITTSSAFNAYDQILAEAGANMGLDASGSWYSRRDAVDERIVNDVIQGTGRIIDDPSQVGGWPVLPSGTPPQDSDHDGMPDNWEIANNFNPNDPSDGPRDNDGNGYTNVEEYLNSPVPGLPDIQDTTPPQTPRNLRVIP